MKNKIIVSGSIAIDTLFHHPDAISPILKGRETASIAFNVRSQDSFFGGCAGNIIFNAALHYSKSHELNPFVLLGFCGNDFSDYKQWLQKNGVDTSHIAKAESAQTSHAYVMSDTNGQQLTFFYEGPGIARAECEPIVLNNLEKLLPEAVLIHVAPNSPWFMRACIEGARKHGVNTVFDPGQVINLFDKNEMHEILSGSIGAFFNEYEYDRAKEILGTSPELMLNAETPLQFIVITKAEKGSKILLRGQDSIQIPTEKTSVVDPTGCGDAYRGAFYNTIYDAVLKHSDDEPNGSSKPRSSIDGHDALNKLFADNKKTREIFTLAGHAGSSLAAKCLSMKGTQRHSI